MTTTIKVGSRLFCTAAPGLQVGALLSKGEFGRRHLERPILYKESKRGEDLKAHYDMGPLASEVIDLSRPRV